MGGGIYDQDVAIRARSSNNNVFAYQGYGVNAVEATETQQQKVHHTLDPFDKVRECNNDTPIVIALDVTRSRGEDTRTVYEKLPMFIGQLLMKQYVPGPAISFAAIGDAHAGDKAPLQVGQFEADNRLDDVLSHVWIEEGGGGTGQESYELAAYFYSRTNLVQYEKTGKKGYFFFVGDEGYYPTLSKKQVRKIIGDKLKKDLDSIEVFKALQEKFHVFFVYPTQSWESRINDIDAEIKKRVQEAGGQYDGVDIRVSLLWNNRNDLDLHVIAPSGERIYYGNKQSRCEGWLDVDMNVRGETSKPVENIRWKTGTAPKGTYQVVVRNFAFHEPKKTRTEFQVECEIDGDIKHFSGTISDKGETGEKSDVVVYTFDYDPSQKQRPIDEDDEKYAGYKDEVIIEQWRRALPEENILMLDDPKAILDVMMGAMAMVEGTSDMEQFLASMRSLDRTTLRQEQIARALEKLALTQSKSKVEVHNLPQTKQTKKKRRTSRL